MCLLGRAQFYQLLGQHMMSIHDFTEIVDVALAMYGQDHLQVGVSYITFLINAHHMKTTFSWYSQYNFISQIVTPKVPRIFWNLHG